MSFSSPTPTCVTSPPSRRSGAFALHAAATGPKEVRWYDAPHALNPAAYVDQLRWLSQTVGTTPPGPEDEAGPQIPPPPAPRPQP